MIVVEVLKLFNATVDVPKDVDMATKVEAGELTRQFMMETDDEAEAEGRRRTMPRLRLRMRTSLSPPARRMRE